MSEGGNKMNMKKLKERGREERGEEDKAGRGG